MSIAPQHTQVPAHCASFIAFDFGTRRTGVAYGTRLLGTAQELPTIAARGDARWLAVQRCIAHWQPDALVVGVPFHPDGAPHENTVRAQQFARQLRGRTGMVVAEVDERYSTTEALSQGAKDPDGAAACIILEQFLRSLT